MNYTYKLYILNDGSNKPYSIIEYHKDITIFIWDIYSLKMNIKTKEDAEKHWNKIGMKQMRLCNKLQLNVVNEFGNEIVLYIPYYYYLYSNHHLQVK